MFKPVPLVNGTILLAKDTSLAIDTVISYAGAMAFPPATIGGNPRFTTFINVWGSDDNYNLMDIGPKNFPSQVKTINIEIEGAQHRDFWYDKDKYPDNLGKNEINRKTYEFMLLLSTAAQNQDQLNGLLSRFSQENGVYKINPDLLP